MGAFHVKGMVQQLLVKLVSTMQDYPKTHQTAILHARGCKRVAEWGARVIQTRGYKRFHQPDFFADEEGIHGECLRNLLDYRSSCCNAALAPTHMWLWTTKAPSQFWSTHTCCTRTVVRDRVGRVYRVQPWWIRYMASVSAALRETPWEGVVDTRSALALYMSDGRGTCGRCLSVAVEHISDFTCSLHAQIAAHVAKVQLPWTDVSS